MENPAMRKVFEDFAKEELEHKAQLELEVMKQGKVPKDFKIANYMVSGELSGDMNYKDALALAMAKEKVSFRLYIDLAAAADDEELKEVFLSLAEEEARHKLRFEIEYDNIKGQG
jgi:rubrerythrin